MNTSIPDDVIVDKAKFDAMLKRLIRAKPTSLEQVKGKPKISNNARPKRTRVSKQKD